VTLERANVAGAVEATALRWLRAAAQLLHRAERLSAPHRPPSTRRAHPGGGMLRATATTGGLVVGTWTRSGIEPFEGLANDVEIALEAERSEVERFMG
jgi:hypothetical protein